MLIQWVPSRDRGFAVLRPDSGFIQLSGLSAPGPPGEDSQDNLLKPPGVEGQDPIED